jgi:hypothetical protein
LWRRRCRRATAFSNDFLPTNLHSQRQLVGFGEILDPIPAKRLRMWQIAAMLKISFLYW